MFKIRSILSSQMNSRLIWVDKPEAKLFIWINIQHYSSGFGVDVGNEESAIFAKICNSNSAPLTLAALIGWQEVLQASRAYLNTVHDF